MMHKSLARKLRILRAERGLSLVEAAGLTGVSRETLSELERGKRGAYTPTLHKIAEGYGVPVEELLGEELAPLVNPPAREGAAFVVVGRIIGGDLRMVVQWNVPKSERETYLPAVRAMLGDDYPEEELPATVAEALATA